MRLKILMFSTGLPQSSTNGGHIGNVYLHDNCLAQEDGTLVIPVELVMRWEKQIATKCSQLSEGERLSDIQQVKRYLPIVSEPFFATQRGMGPYDANIRFKKNWKEP